MMGIGEVDTGNRQAARATGTNLVIFPNKQQAGYQFNIVDREIL
jgi:hypothetical protein